MVCKKRNYKKLCGIKMEQFKEQWNIDICENKNIKVFVYSGTIERICAKVLANCGAQVCQKSHSDLDKTKPLLNFFVAKVSIFLKAIMQCKFLPFFFVFLSCIPR